MNLPLSYPLIASLCHSLPGAEATGIIHSFLALGGKTYIRTCTPDDPAGKITGEYPALTRDGLVLPNGNTVISSYYASKPGQIRLLKVAAGKKDVWIHRNDDKPGIHELHILDTNGIPLAGPPLK